MTKQEFEYWKGVTERSIGEWQVDHISAWNKGGALLYKGGEKGQYVWIELDGTTTLGIYEGAYPHIGEAIFARKGRKKYLNRTTAINIILKQIPQVGGAIAEFESVLKNKESQKVKHRRW